MTKHISSPHYSVLHDIPSLNESRVGIGGSTYGASPKPIELAFKLIVYIRGFIVVPTHDVQ